MSGEVDDSGRALIAIRLRVSVDADVTVLAAWVDTAFTGVLVIPRGTVERLGLRQSAAVMAGLADGTQVVLRVNSGDAYFIPPRCLPPWSRPMTPIGAGDHPSSRPSHGLTQF